MRCARAASAASLRSRWRRSRSACPPGAVSEEDELLARACAQGTAGRRAYPFPGYRIFGRRADPREFLQVGGDAFFLAGRTEFFHGARQPGPGGPQEESREPRRKASAPARSRAPSGQALTTGAVERDQAGGLERHGHAHRLAVHDDFQKFRQGGGHPVIFPARRPSPSACAGAARIPDPRRRAGRRRRARRVRARRFPRRMPGGE